MNALDWFEVIDASDGDALAVIVQIFAAGASAQRESDARKHAIEGAADCNCLIADNQLVTLPKGET